MNKLRKKISLSLLSMMMSLTSVGYLSSSKALNSENITSISSESEDMSLLNEFSELAAEEFVSNIRPHDLNPIIPMYVGWQDDLHSSMYFWNKTKTGRCIANLFSPSHRLKELIKSLGQKAVSKSLTKASLIATLKGKGLSVALAGEVADCIFTYWVK